MTTSEALRENLVDCAATGRTIYVRFRNRDRSLACALGRVVAVNGSCAIVLVGKKSTMPVHIEAIEVLDLNPSAAVAQLSAEAMNAAEKAAAE